MPAVVVPLNSDLAYKTMTSFWGRVPGHMTASLDEEKHLIICNETSD